MMENTTTQKLEVAKDFSAPVSELYNAWIREEDLKNWWHPMGNNLQEMQNEVVRGGDIKYVFANHEGAHSFTITGNYKEVEEGRRLVYTWNWEIPADNVGEANYMLAVSFTEVDSNRSRIEVVQQDFRDDEAVQPHKEGWELALDRLEQYLSQKN